MPSADDDEQPENLPPIVVALGVALAWLLLGLLLQVMVDPRPELSDWGFYENAGGVMAISTMLVVGAWELLKRVPR